MQDRSFSILKPVITQPFDVPCTTQRVIFSYCGTSLLSAYSRKNKNPVPGSLGLVLTKEIFFGKTGQFLRKSISARSFPLRFVFVIQIVEKNTFNSKQEILYLVVKEDSRVTDVLKN